MTITVIKNQKAAIEVIRKHSIDRDTRNKLFDFTKDLANALLDRVKENDCYTIDMLEDISNIKIED